MTETMTALQLAREAKEANGDCWYENKPVYIRTEDGRRNRAMHFNWDPGYDGFVIGVEEYVPPAPPPVPDALAVAIGDHVFTRDDVGTTPVFSCPGNCHPHPLDWAELNELAEKEAKPVVVLRPDPADDAPELPWSYGEDETEDKVHVSGRNVYIHITPGYVLPEEAELRAAVILRAARDARRTAYRSGS